MKYKIAAAVIAVILSAVVLKAIGDSDLIEIGDSVSRAQRTTQYSYSEQSGGAEPAAAYTPVKSEGGSPFKYYYYRLSETEQKAYGNIPGDVLEFLTETDRKDTNGQRKSKDHADMSGGYEDGEEDEQTGEFHRSAMDRAAYQQWVRKESRDDEVDDPIYPDELLKQQFVPGDNKANNQRWQMRRQVVQQFIPRLTRKQRDTVNRYYGMAMTEAQIGKEDGTGKQAVSNILNEDVKPNLREVFTRLGFDVPTEEELKAEDAARKDREDARKEAEKNRRSEEREIRMIHAVVSGEASEEDYIETGTVKYEPSEDDMEAETRDTALMDDFDPDNPYDSVSDDYDPYDDPMYQDDEDEDYWEEEDVAEPDDE